MDNSLVILWTNADPVTAEMMVFMYAENAKVRGWWDRVKIVVWGATAKLVAEDEEIQEKLLDLQSKGIEVSFCIACATKLGVVRQIDELGFELKAWGMPLTELLKNDAKLLTV
ncbi:DsrE family protein [Clostridium sp. DL1XJH146]